MKNLNDRFMNAAINYVNAWFDYHPEPQNIEMYEFLFNRDIITIFAAEMIHDNYMIKIECPTASRALRIENQVSKLVMIMGLSLIRINRKLFLFTDKRF